jgi:glycosyltransferase involved in cell wall biosynthesis
MSVYFSYLARALELNGAEITILGFGRKPSMLESCKNIRYRSLGPDPGLLDWMGGIATTYWYIRRRLHRALERLNDAYDIAHFIYPEATIHPKDYDHKVVSSAWGYSSPREIIKDARHKFSGIWQGLGPVAELQFYYADLAGLRDSDGIVCTTRESEKFWRGRTGNPTTYLPLPVELPPERKPATNAQTEPGTVTFLFAERQLERPRNNLSTVFRAIQLLEKRQFSKFQIHLVGGHGPRLRSYISQLNSLGFRVYLHSYLPRDEFFDLLRTVDVYLAPRYVKDQGGYLPLEAMARGIAVMASDTPAFRDIVNHGTTGLLTEPFNAVDLSKGIQLVLDDREYLERMKTEARRFVHNFHSLEISGQMHLAFYERVVAQ